MRNSHPHKLFQFLRPAQSFREPRHGEFAGTLLAIYAAPTELVCRARFFYKHVAAPQLWLIRRRLSAVSNSMPGAGKTVEVFPCVEKHENASSEATLSP